MGEARWGWYRNEWQFLRGISLGPSRCQGNAAGQALWHPRAGSAQDSELALQAQALASDPHPPSARPHPPQVRWMMYWIVFALFMAVEAFSDIFISWYGCRGSWAVGGDVPPSNWPCG